MCYSYLILTNHLFSVYSYTLYLIKFVSSLKNCELPKEIQNHFVPSQALRKKVMKDFYGDNEIIMK